MAGKVAELHALKTRDPGRLEELGEKARRHVAEKYDADRSFAALHDLLTATGGGGRPQ